VLGDFEQNFSCEMAEKFDIPNGEVVSLKSRDIEKHASNSVLEEQPPIDSVKGASLGDGVNGTGVQITYILGPRLYLLFGT
jgi:hypothetical protein